MKICFFLQRRFARLGHALACHMSENSANQFCAYVGLRKNLEFLKNQKDIKYTGLLLDQDVHEKALKEKPDLEYQKSLEAEYGLPNLWPYLYLDRVLMNGQLIREYPYNKPTASHEEMLILLQGTARAIIKFIDEEKPDVLVISVVGSLASSLLYHIAKKKGVMTINIDLPRINNLATFSEDYKTLTFAEKTFQKINAGKESPARKKAKDFISSFREKPTPYYKDFQPDFNKQTSRLANLLFLQPRSFFKSLSWHLKQVYLELNRKNKDYDDIEAWWMIYDKIKRKIRGLVGYEDLFEQPKENESYAFYPLHFEPEIAILLFAPLYADQVELIKQAARSLPVGFKLYVKEHPCMVGYRKRSFYKKIKQIPNVRLIHPSTYGPGLVKKCKMVITISSTSGWEATIMGKPVITFGDVFYNILPSVQRCRSFEELAYIVKNKLEKSGHDEKTLENYVSALIEESVDVDYIDLWNKAGSDEQMMNDPGVKKMATLLLEKIKNHGN